MDSVASSQAVYTSSNSVVGKLVFVILVVIMFTLLLQIGLYLISWFNSPPKDPFLIKGMLDGGTKVTISQDPKNADSVQILRSNDDKGGAAFTWSVWIYIDDLLCVACVCLYDMMYVCVSCRVLLLLLLLPLPIIISLFSLSLSLSN